MALQKLSARAIETAKQRGYLNDGGGLYLRVGPQGSKSWVFRFQLNGRKREMGLGAYPDVPLKEARDLALHCRRQVREGIDPIAQRNAIRRAQALEKLAEPFSVVATQYLNRNQAGMSLKTIRSWRTVFDLYVFPIIGQVQIDQVQTDDVVRVLTPIWNEKNETAKRARSRIEAVLDAARVEELRTGENPARWKGHLDKLFPAPRKVHRVSHHRALPYSEMPTFMAALRSRDGTAARALEFLILTVVRSGEVRSASWADIDTDESFWLIPAEKMKMGNAEHFVPLSPPAADVVHGMAQVCTGALVFPSERGGELSDMTLSAVVKRMGYHDRATVHGFRSTFRDWVAEQTEFPGEVAEACLAHVTQGVEAAYRRTDFKEKRRNLMDLWAKYCRE